MPSLPALLYQPSPSYDHLRPVSARHTTWVRIKQPSSDKVMEYDVHQRLSDRTLTPGRCESFRSLHHGPTVMHQGFPSVHSVLAGLMQHHFISLRIPRHSATLLRRS
ncbi:unnamed protein product [Somion occarium]|uniref:Uncharacterized protein n=1 Tax=Somion occarium TaxID=3059160 RepID=A0ABP1EBN9_9APHY